MSNKLVSIIIPTYNRADLISETLDSILKQTYQNWECLIIDDGSKDNTKEIINVFLKKHKRFKFFERPSNMPKGANACRNYGLEKSLGSVINFFDSDDLMLPEKLEKQMRLLEKSSLQFCVCQTLIFKGNPSNIIGLRKPSVYSDDFFNDFVTNKIKWLTQAPLIKKDFLEQHNLKFNESLMKSQERDFFIKILSKINDYIYDDAPLVLHRLHNENISSGKMDKQKLWSQFMVDYNILKQYDSKLNKEAKKYLKKQLKSTFRKSVVLYDMKFVFSLKKMLFTNEVGLSHLKKMKLLLGIFMLKFLGKGEVLFK